MVWHMSVTLEREEKMALSNTADDVDADAALAQQQKCYRCCSCAIVSSMLAPKAQRA